MNSSRENLGNRNAGYLYDGWQVIEERDSQDSITNVYVYGELDQPIQLTTNNTTYYYHYNHQGSIEALTDKDGTIVERYAYNPYGTVTITDADDVGHTDSTVGNPYFYTARRLDPETGLYDYRHRYYSAALGRFIQRDPLGYLDGENLYAYVQSNPINFVDPLGLFGEDVHFGEPKVEITRIRDDFIIKITEQDYGTYKWATDVGFTAHEARTIGRANIGTDSILPGGTGPWPWSSSDKGRARHFDVPLGGVDSRIQWSKTELNNAVEFWKSGDNKKALKSLGRGLHSLQDTTAHGAWDNEDNVWKVHEDPSGAYPDDWFDARNKWKQKETEIETKEYLTEFKNRISENVGSGKKGKP